SLPHLEKALELSKQVNNNERLLSSAYYNIGKNYGDLEEYNKAEIYLKKAAEISEKYKLGNLPHSLFTYAKLLFKQGKTTEAIQ
ncbi:tetratricopeptide repeat protein, partial [Pseudomonas aeruginosa]